MLVSGPLFACLNLFIYRSCQLLGDFALVEVAP